MYMANAIWFFVGVVLIPLVVALVARAVMKRGEEEKAEGMGDVYEPFGSRGPRIPPVE
jgi:hypothetical protein